MIEECCNCGWDIQGVDRLPPHVHRILRTVRKDRTGQVLTFNTWHWVDNDGWTVLGKDEILLFSVDWKAVAKAL